MKSYVVTKSKQSVGFYFNKNSEHRIANSVKYATIYEITDNEGNSFQRVGRNSYSKWKKIRKSQGCVIEENF